MTTYFVTHRNLFPKRMTEQSELHTKKKSKIIDCINPICPFHQKSNMRRWLCFGCIGLLSHNNIPLRYCSNCHHYVTTVAKNIKCHKKTQFHRQNGQLVFKSGDVKKFIVNSSPFIHRSPSFHLASL